MMKISDLKAGSSNVEIKAEIVDIEPPREINKMGRTLRVANATLKHERERTRRGETSELMDLLISRKWLDMFGPFNKHPRAIAQTSIKFHKKGAKA